MKNLMVTEILLALTTAVFAGMLFSGCGGEPACQSGGCGPDPTSDGGMVGGDNPITKEDGGTKDGGDATNGDAGGDNPHACDNFTEDEGTWYRTDEGLKYGLPTSLITAITGEDCTVTWSGEGAGLSASFKGKNYCLVIDDDYGKTSLCKESGSIVLKDEPSSGGTFLQHFSRTKPN